MTEPEHTDKETSLIRAAQRLASVGGWEYDIRAETLTCTDEVTQIVGREPSESMTLETSIDEFHPADQPSVRAAIDNAVEAGEPFESEWRLRPQDREQRWVQIYGEPERMDGTVVRIRGAIEDITAEKQHKQRLNRLFETTRRLFEQDTADAVASVAVDAANDVLGLSLSGIHLHDPDADVLAPTTMTDDAIETFGEPPTFKPGESIAWEVFETGEARIFDDVQSDDGTHNPETDVRSELLLPLGDHGVFIASSPQASAFDDRTVSMGKLLAANVETALNQLDREQQLRQQNERLEEFASIVSHDLRNPLSVAKAGIEVAKRKDGEGLGEVERAHSRMDTLIDDLLSLARTGQDIDPAALDSLSIAEAASHAWTAVETSEATLETEGDGTVVADASRLQQLLENLYRNSIEHSDGPVTIRVGTLADGFYIADDGPGISPADRDAVFEAGYTTSDDGTGFGLRIVRTVADAHGWDAAVTESEAGGARIEITGVET